MGKISFTARDDLIPKCPYCGKDLGEISFKTTWKFLLALSANTSFFCPHCQKSLSCSQSRPGRSSSD